MSSVVTTGGGSSAGAAAPAAPAAPAAAAGVEAETVEPITEASPRLWLPLHFRGRLGRAEYVVLSLAWHLVSGLAAGIAFVVVLVPLGFVADAGAVSGVTGVMLAAMAFVYLAGHASYGVRRLHDLGRSGWWIVLGFVPLVNVVLGLLLLVVPGTPGANAHGERARSGTVTFAPENGAAAVLGPSSDEAFEAGRRFAERQGGSPAGG